MKVTVIIAAYGSPDNVRLVLHALARQKIVPDEVIIADDGTTPPLSGNLEDMVDALPFRVVHVWQPDEGFRAARSRNNAIYHARNDRLAFLDQDVLPHHNWLQAHLAYAGSRRVCLARVLPLSPTDSAHLSPDAIARGSFETWHDVFYFSKLERQQRKYRLYALMRRLGLPFKRTRPSLSSGNIAAWKPDLVNVNGFDEAYIGWGQEDDDLGRRLYMAGVRPAPLLTTAMASHIHHPVRHPDWREGPNLTRYRERFSACRCELGLDDHPHPDVKVTVLKA